ncbi:hypothetical protein F4859DRAFT_509123 [Xylaria cf. heliscus]|nr:hypothetical protein F4859DRAFT_509123 [Xylaria cf. heliscus]
MSYAPVSYTPGFSFPTGSLWSTDYSYPTDHSYSTDQSYPPDHYSADHSSELYLQSPTEISTYGTSTERVTHRSSTRSKHHKSSRRSKHESSTTSAAGKPVWSDNQTIDFLRGIADARWNQQQLTVHVHANSMPFDAATITKLAMRASLAAREPSSSRIKRFAARYKQDEKSWDVRAPFSKVEDMLHGYFERIDELFFFELLGSRIRDHWGGERKLIVLNVKASMPDTLGIYYPTNDNIDIPLSGFSYVEYSFGHLILTLVHEMTHAYLGIFSDGRDACHFERVDYQNGHGKMFWVLLKFIINNIFMFTKSNDFWEQFLKSEDEHYRCFCHT